MVLLGLALTFRSSPLLLTQLDSPLAEWEPPLGESTPCSQEEPRGWS